MLTHWCRTTHICVGKLTTIGSDNGLAPGRPQAIIWNNAGLLLIEPLGTNFSEISIGIQTFSFKKMHLNMSSAKWRPFCLGLNVLTQGAVSLNLVSSPNQFSWYLNFPFWKFHSSPCGIVYVRNFMMIFFHDDIIKWKHFRRYWPFVQGIHWSLVNSLHRGQWRKSLMFCLIYAWMIGRVNNHEAGNLRCHHDHYDIIVMQPIETWA